MTYKLAASAIALAIVGYAAPSSADPTVPDVQDCPAEVRGVRISSSNVNGGVAFTFTSPTTNQLPALRALLREAAVIIEHQSKLAALHPDQMATSDGSGNVPALDISVKNTARGAVVVVRPEEETDLAMLRGSAHQFEMFWSSHACVAPKPPAISGREKAAPSSPRKVVRSTDARAAAPSRVP